MLALSVLTISACEGYRCAKGIVVDAETMEPLHEVTCYVKTADITWVTDSTGSFDVCNGMSGCVSECQPIVIWFSKEGYIPQELVNEDAEGKILLKKED